MTSIEINIGDYTASIPYTPHPTNPFLKHNKGLIYFVTDGRAVKIGKTDNLECRLTSIQTGNPYPIVLLCNIESNDLAGYESCIHSFFDEYRIASEWFDLLPVFGIDTNNDDNVFAFRKEIAKLKRENRQLKSENSRWRNAKYSHEDKFCSACGHPLEPWWENYSAKVVSE